VGTPFRKIFRVRPEHLKSFGVRDSCGLRNISIDGTARSAAGLFYFAPIFISLKSSLCSIAPLQAAE
jgi:hypothetical protein